MKMKKSPLLKMRQRFCKHVFGEYWSVKYDPVEPYVIFYQHCKKCNMVREVRMPLENVKKPYQELQRRKKRFMA